MPHRPHPPRRPPAARRRGERGHSGLELLLLMPFLFLVIALLINLGHLHRNRIRLDSAAHLASLEYAGLRSDGESHADAQRTARDDVTAHYYEDLDVTVSTSGPSFDPSEDPDGLMAGDGDDGASGAWDVASVFFPLNQSQQTARLERTIDPPMFSSAFPEKRMKASMTVQANTWTFNEWDLLYGSQSYDGDSGFGLGDLADFFRWPFGMVGKVPCDRTKGD